jgi:hypothetical protein
MQMNFPSFDNSHFFWITACGELPSADKGILKWMKEEKDKTSRIKTSRGTGFTRFILGGREGNHVHFDVVSPEIATKKLKEESKSTLGDIQKSMGRLWGKEIEANLKGGFQANLRELPESGIIRSLLFNTKMGNVAIKLAGATLSIEGAPVQRISWGAASKGNIHITLEAELIKTALSENYLIEAADVLQRAFDIFVLGKAKNEPA